VFVTAPTAHSHARRRRARHNAERELALHSHALTSLYELLADEPRFSKGGDVPSLTSSLVKMAHFLAAQTHEQKSDSRGRDLYAGPGCMCLVATKCF